MPTIFLSLKYTLAEYHTHPYLRILRLFNGRYDLALYGFTQYKNYLCAHKQQKQQQQHDLDNTSGNRLLQFYLTTKPRLARTYVFGCFTGIARQNFMAVISNNGFRLAFPF